MCMCKCVCEYMCVYVYVCMCLCVHVCVCVCVSYHHLLALRVMGIENGGLGQNLVNPPQDCADGRDWDLEFEKSPACSWSVEASNTAKAGAMFLGENQFYAATGVDIPKTNVMYRRLAYATELLQCCTACLTMMLPSNQVPFWRQLTVAILAKT